MKKNILLIITAVCVTTFAQAQEGFKFGLRAGVNYSTINGPDAEEYFDKEGPSFKFGYHAGLVANYGFSESVSIQPEVLYSTKGFSKDIKKVENGLKSENDYKLKLAYVDVPLLVKYNYRGIYFEVGPQASFLISADETQKGNYELIEGEKIDVPETSVDAKDKIESVDIGYVLGVGYMTRFGFTAGLRYTGGFTNFADEPGDADDIVVKNQVFQLTLGYMFGGE